MSFGAHNSFYNRLIMGLAESRFEKYVNELFKWAAFYLWKNIVAIKLIHLLVNE